MDDNSEFAGKNPSMGSSFLRFDNFRNMSSEDFGRESLGLLDFSDMRRESLIFGDFYGRESLGLLDLDYLNDIRESLGALDITNMGLTNVGAGVLNTSFLSHSPLSPSILHPGNVSYRADNITRSHPSSVALMSVNDKQYLNGIVEKSSHKDITKTTMSSLVEQKVNSSFHPGTTTSPPKMQHECPDLCELYHHNPVRICQGNTENCLMEFSGTLDGSVLIANYTEDGNNSFMVEDSKNMLDSTQEPEELAVTITEKEPEKCDTGQIFKSVDKLFASRENEERENATDVMGRSTKISRSASMEAMQIISSLSVIVSGGGRSREQVSKAQSILSDLKALILADESPKSVVLDDSGRSPIGAEPIPLSEREDYFQVLDLRVKRTPESNNVCVEDSVDNMKPLDLSLKSKSSDFIKVFRSSKHLPPKINETSKSAILFRTTGNEDGANLTNAKRLQVRKTEDKSGGGRGPMKAVLPLDNMVRKSCDGVKSTPSRSGLKLTKVKKTCTPVSRTDFEPIAQSTPETLPSVYSSRRTKQKLNYFDANFEGNNDPLQQKSKLPTVVRRPSVDSLRSIKNCKAVLSRSGVGEKIEVTKKPVETRRRSSPVKRLSSSRMRVSQVLKENTNCSKIKPSLTTKIGKENLN